MTWALIIALSIGPRSPSPSPRVPDAWFGVDKWKHFVASAVVESLGYGVASGRRGHQASLRVGAGAVVAIGLGKEFYDWRAKRQFSRKDLVWDLLGGAVAAVALHAVR